VAAGVKLPNADRAVVPQRKILEYLLNFDHVDGAAKAGFFTRFGYSRENWSALADALRRHALLQPVVSRRHGEHGELFEITGPISTPDGRNPRITSVWIVLGGEFDPRFVTAVPA
jgi:hypothetical protein